MTKSTIITYIGDYQIQIQIQIQETRGSNSLVYGLYYFKEY